MSHRAIPFEILVNIRKCALGAVLDNRRYARGMKNVKGSVKKNKNVWGRVCEIFPPDLQWNSSTHKGVFPDTRHCPNF